MDQKSLRDRIEKADGSLLDEAASLSDSDLAFTASLTPVKIEARELQIDLAGTSHAKWSRDLLFRMLKDKDGGIRSRAAEGLPGKVIAEDAKRLLAELEADQTRSEEDDEFSMFLIRAVGNTGDTKMIEPLMVLQKKENRPQAGHAYRQALAKLGFPKETRKLEFTLENGTPKEKGIALRDLRYINRPEWVAKAVPLLMDEMTARQTSKGDIDFKIRVCDEAITTLGIIDPQKKIPFEVSDVFGVPFHVTKLAQARRAYGLIK
ncbi:MAG: hypothetical protein M3Y08_19230 [Fibrobacterota bacterium]|nr:hypothetical protein [Fibrobacterota bacterium]